MRPEELEKIIERQYTVYQACEALGIHPNTLRRLIPRKIKAFKRRKNNRMKYIIYENSLRKYMRLNSYNNIDKRLNSPFKEREIPEDHTIISAKEAANILKVTVKTIYRKCRTNQDIISKKNSQGHYEISAESVLKYKEEEF